MEQFPPAATPPQVPLVGVGVLIFRDGQLLLGRRRGSHGAGSWSAPGGHLEFGESVEHCARREVYEETGLRLDTVLPGPWTTSLFPEDKKHYVTLITRSWSDEGAPQRREPEKCDGWQWFALQALPEPLFHPLAQLIAAVGLPGLEQLAIRPAQIK
ncbi:nucleotide triphosphate diphosphatase NUDT15 [Entomohabitans teleogrylli]|uniref:nucleotide triphosphate diphosphatase NUDT15 n=1 Tax=Entomohabitans teleogrylli TaxID=1384589 RepID=UPI00073D5047|nr:NUDIX hydrolase [Entomohabitans teleogrylli]